LPEFLFDLDPRRRSHGGAAATRKLESADNGRGSPLDNLLNSATANNEIARQVSRNSVMAVGGAKRRPFLLRNMLSQKENAK